MQHSVSFTCESLKSENPLRLTMPIAYNANTRRFEEARGTADALEPYFLPHKEGFHPQATKEWTEVHLQGARVVACRDLPDVSGRVRVSTAELADWIKTGWFIWSATKIMLVSSAPSMVWIGVLLTLEIGKKPREFVRGVI